VNHTATMVQHSHKSQGIQNKDKIPLPFWPN